MKYLSKDEEVCIQCHVCEDICSETFFKEFDEEKSCIRINDYVTEEENWIINVCNQCGECILACSEEAISTNSQGVVMINKKKCVGCLVCVGFCPSLSMRSHDDLIEPFKCIACGKCAKGCPTEAIKILTEAEEVASAKE